MSRKPNTPIVIDEPNINQVQFAADHAALNEVARMNAEASDNAHALAAQLGYDGSLTVGALEDEIRFYQRRTAETCIELGKRLLLLKELTPHGEFAQRIDMLGFGKSTAYRFMQSAKKFSKLPKLGSLAITNASAGKFMELLILDDDQLAELDEGGSALGITLDDIDCLSASELRKKLREAQADAAATDRVLEEKSKSITKLQKEVAGKQIDPQAEWSEAMRSLNAHVAAHRNTFVESVTALDVIREKVMDQVAEPGEEAALEAAREQIGREIAGAIQRAEDIVAAVRRKFDVTLGALID